MSSEPSVAGGSSRRLCGWCGEAIREGARSDAKHCSKQCRQSAWRMRKGCKARTAAAEPLRLAYADPPYPGLSHYYRGHADYAGEVDHAELVERLEPYDGWALSTSAAALNRVLRMCPTDVQIAAWTRGGEADAVVAPALVLGACHLSGGPRVHVEPRGATDRLARIRLAPADIGPPARDGSKASSVRVLDVRSHRGQARRHARGLVPRIRRDRASLARVHVGGGRVRRVREIPHPEREIPPSASASVRPARPSWPSGRRSHRIPEKSAGIPVHQADATRRVCRRDVQPSLVDERRLGYAGGMAGTEKTEKTDEEMWQERQQAICAVLGDALAAGLADGLIIGGQRYTVAVRRYLGGSRADEGVTTAITVENEMEHFDFSVHLDGFGFTSKGLDSVW